MEYSWVERRVTRASPTRDLNERIGEKGLQHNSLFQERQFEEQHEGRLRRGDVQASEQSD